MELGKFHRQSWQQKQGEAYGHVRGPIAQESQFPVETVEIRPRVSGYIDKVAFTEGSVVKAGDLLFVIDPRPYKPEYDRAAADVKRYKTTLELARIESVRVQKLKESGAVSQEELDERASTHDEQACSERRHLVGS